MRISDWSSDVCSSDLGWVEVRQIGPTGTTCAYIINDRVAWTGKRDGIRYSLFSAAVLIADDEQPDREELGAQPALHRLPNLFPGERQLPSGPGLPPPSEPSRSEEHTSELQSLMRISYAVFCLKKKT